MSLRLKVIFTWKNQISLYNWIVNSSSLWMSKTKKKKKKTIQLWSSNLRRTHHNMDAYDTFDIEDSCNQ